MKKRLLMMLAGLGMFALPMSGATVYLEDFEEYATDTVLTERTDAGAETVSVNGYHVSMYHSGTKQLVVTGDTDKIGSVAYGIRALFWKDGGTEITNAITEDSVAVYEVSARYISSDPSTSQFSFGAGNMGNAGGTTINRAFNISASGSSGSLVAADGSTLATFTTINAEFNYKVYVDAAANSGDGSITLLYKASTAPSWTTVVEDANLQLKSKAAVDSLTEWTSWISDNKYAYIDDVKAYSVPEPATMVLVSAGSAILMIRRKRK